MICRLLPSLVVLIVLASCRPNAETASYDVHIAVDGGKQTYSVAEPLTVDELLANAQIDLGTLDRISHPLVAQVSDGMLITIRRVTEEQACERQEIPFRRRVLPREGIPAGGRQLGQAGAPGIEEACYRILLEDGEEVDRSPMDDPVLVLAPVDEIVYSGPEAMVTPIAIAGRLSYINHNDAWTIAGQHNKQSAADSRTAFGLASLSAERIGHNARLHQRNRCNR